jgi:catechol 2,3-dioxygenase-like lactoylglutathione lyase family enzyme
VKEVLPMNIDHLDHVVLTVQDIKATCAFYQKALGMDMVHFGPGRTALQRTAQKAPFFHKTGMNGRSFRAGWDGDAPGFRLVAEESVQGWRGFAVPEVSRKKERKAGHSHVLE